MNTQLAGSILLKRLDYLEVLLNSFEFFRVWKIMEPWTVNVKFS